MVGRAVPTAIAPSGARRYRFRLLRGRRRPDAPAGLDRVALVQSATSPAARRRPWPAAEIAYGGEASWRPPLSKADRRPLARKLSRAQARKYVKPPSANNAMF